MSSINTKEVEQAFSDLLKELNRVKDLNDVAESYKTTASNLAETLGTLIKASDQTYSQNKELLEGAVKQLADQVERYKVISNKLPSLDSYQKVNHDFLIADIQKIAKELTKLISQQSESSYTTFTKSLSEAKDSLLTDVTNRMASYESKSSELLNSISQSIKQLPESERTIFEGLQLLTIEGANGIKGAIIDELTGVKDFISKETTDKISPIVESLNSIPERLEQQKKDICERIVSNTDSSKEDIQKTISEKNNSVSEKLQDYYAKADEKLTVISEYNKITRILVVVFGVLGTVIAVAALIINFIHF